MKRSYLLITWLLLLSLILASCAQATPEKIIEKIIETVEVEKQVVVEKEVVVTQEVVVEKEVQVEKIVEVTPIAMDYGKVTIFSTQATPIEEQEKVRGIVLADFAGTPEFITFEEPALLDRVTAEVSSAKGSADVIIALHGTYPNLLAADAMMDLSDMAAEAASLGIPEAFMQLGKLGTDTQYYIPVMKAVLRAL